MDLSAAARRIRLWGDGTLQRVSVDQLGGRKLRRKEQQNLQGARRLRLDRCRRGTRCRRWLYVLEMFL